MTTLQTPLIGAAALTSSTDPTIGYRNVYDASSGSLSVTLPALSGLNVGARLSVGKSDSSVNTVTVTRDGSDTFQDASTSFVMKVPGERVELQVVSVSSTKYWATVSSHLPLASADARYQPIGSPTDRLTNTLQTIPRWSAVQNCTLQGSGALALVYLTADQTLTPSGVAVGTYNTAAAATPTLVRFGLYSVDTGSGDLTLIASTPNDTTLLAATYTIYSKSWSTPVELNRGVRYALGLLVVTGTTMPTLIGANAYSGSFSSRAPAISHKVAGQSDLPASVAFGSLTASGSVFYAIM